MTTQELQKNVLRILGTIAPEADLGSIKPAVPFRDQLDLDSMDFLNFVIAMHKELKVDIPEADYAKVATLDGCVAYIQAHQPVVAG
ncbi:MAG: acyl carrier protein [Actinomycetota bacterium]